MGLIKNLRKRVKLVYRPSSKRTRMVILSALILSVAALIALNLTIAALENRTQDLTNQAGQLEQENSQLQEDIQQLGTVDSVIKIAKDIWGLIFPDTVVIEPEK